MKYLFILFVAFSAATYGRSKDELIDNLRRSAIEQRDSSQIRSKLVESNKRSSDVRMSIGPSVAILGSSTGFGVNGEVSFRASRQDPFYAGFMGGYSHWRQDKADASTSFHVMPTMLYHFERNEAASIHPYVGFGSGVAILKPNGNTNLGFSNAEDRTLFVFLFRPGVALTGVIEDFSAGFEPRMGFYGPAFTFMPQFVLSFSL